MSSHNQRRMLLLGIVSALTIACGAFFRLPQLFPGSLDSQTEGTSRSDTANGERIYFTATNDEGERITYRGGPNFGGMMMGSYLTCAACHGPEARGGNHFMHMQVMDAPDIRYAALQGESDEHGEDGHGDEHGAEYTLEDFRLAVIEGKHPDGEALSRDMPRWQMDEQDLRDLFEFLTSVP
jgi:cytochrome c oxidase subunit 2